MTTFRRFLSSHRKIDNRIGDLARDVAYDSCWPHGAKNPETYIRHLQDHDAIPEAIEALKIAWREWQDQELPVSINGQDYPWLTPDRKPENYEPYFGDVGFLLIRFHGEIRPVKIMIDGARARLHQDCKKPTWFRDLDTGVRYLVAGRTKDYYRYGYEVLEVGE